MNGKKFSVTATGDSLFVSRFPSEYKERAKELLEFMDSCQLKITNLETNFSDFEYYANAYSGGTWINTPREYLNDLLIYNFDFYGTANNHAMDYGHNGLLSTIRTLDEHGLNHAGTGESLIEASKPAIINIGDKKIAIFAVDTSFLKPSMAGRATDVIPARPGVNYLRYEQCYKISEEQANQLREIIKDTKINFTKDMLINTGFGRPDPEGFIKVKDILFTTKTDIPDTWCNKADKERILSDIRPMKEQNDYVFVQVHCQANDGGSHAHPPAFLREFAKSCIDNGASAIFGGGCHELRGLEMYKGLPIFYSLGDFIYQGMEVEHLPADFKEPLGIDVNASAKDALYARSRGGTVGLHLSKANYLTILPKMEFEGDKLISLDILPVTLNFSEKGKMNGLPVKAEQEVQEIYNILKELSSDFGTNVQLVDQMIKVI